jgi:hypothetical protein
MRGCAASRFRRHSVRLGEAGVELAELDARLVGGDQARGAEGDHELRFALVGAEQGIQSFALQESVGHPKPPLHEWLVCDRETSTFRGSKS